MLVVFRLPEACRVDVRFVKLDTVLAVTLACVLIATTDDTADTAADAADVAVDADELAILIVVVKPVNCVLKADTVELVLDKPVVRLVMLVVLPFTIVDKLFTVVDVLLTTVDRFVTVVDVLLMIVDRFVTVEAKLFTTVIDEPSVLIRVSTLVKRVSTLLRLLPTALTAPNNWLPLTASVLDDVTRPAATFVMVRSAPRLPTLTVPTGAMPALLYVLPKKLVLGVAIAAVVDAPAPMATALSPALAPLPMATALLPVVPWPAFRPIATLLLPVLL
jgi:hypothetical protein